MTAEDRNSTAAVKSKLTYPEFLDALAMLSERMYGQTARRYRSSGAAQVVAAEPSGGTCCGRSTEDAFQQVTSQVRNTMYTRIFYPWVVEHRWCT